MDLRENLQQLYQQELLQVSWKRMEKVGNRLILGPNRKKLRSLIGILIYVYWYIYINNFSVGKMWSDFYKLREKKNYLETIECHFPILQN